MWDFFCTFAAAYDSGKAVQFSRCPAAVNLKTELYVRMVTAERWEGRSKGDEPEYLAYVDIDSSWIG